MDLKPGWDFTKEKDRAIARDMMERDQPQLIIGSPPCTAFSSLQKMNEAKWRGQPGKEKQRHKVWSEAVKHAEFCLELYRYQLQHGGRFLHEHPLGASSWGIVAMQSLLQDSRVMQVKADMRRFGMNCEEWDQALYQETHQVRH